MDTTSKTTVSKFMVKSALKIYAKINWETNGSDVFFIKIFAGDNSWSGQFSRETGKQFIALTDETEEQYYKNITMCLTAQSSLYTYEFAQTSDNTAQFSWKRHFEESSVLLVHGSVTMHRDTNPESRDTLIEYLLSENLRLQQNIEDMKKNYEKVTEDFAECKNGLEEFVNIKTSLEQMLYGKFVSLLNTKKRRVQLLEDTLNRISGADNNQDNDNGDPP